MKIRQGFVSNSSSSSFVIAKCYIPDDKYDDFIERLEEITDEVSEEMFYFDETEYYIMGDVSNHTTLFTDLIEELKLDDFVGFGD
jgi:hypothetical protein